VKREIRADAASLARDRIMEFLLDEDWMRDPKNGRAALGVIVFALKNDPDDPWSDKRDVSHSGTVTFAEALAMTRPDRMKAE
jgi:hypothetical protein